MFEKTTVKFSEAIIVLLIMLAIMGIGVIGFGVGPQIPVLLVIAIVILWAKIRGMSWDDIHKGITEGVATGVVPLVIFLLVGVLISIWIAAGIIPSIMVAGFHMLSAKWFVPSIFIVCALIGVSIGSAFTTISTVGVALFGMGAAMHLNPALVAGAIISGAIFGDKTSPLSDSTNLASAVAQADLFKHIKNLMWSTIPALIVSLILYAIIGHQASGRALTNVAPTVNALNANFAISWWALLPILLMFVCAFLKIPAIPTLMVNIATGVVMIFIHNPHMQVSKLVTMMESGYVADTGNKSVNALLSRGGISSMMGTVSLIILTLSLGGLLMKCQLMQTAMAPLAARIHRNGSLVTASVLCGVFVNLFVGEQYLAIILPGKAFKKTFNEHGLDNLALSRALEDGGTVINYLVPWGVGSSFAASALGVPTLAFLPFCFFSIASPIFSIISGYTGIGLKTMAKTGAKMDTADAEVKVDHVVTG